MSSSKHDLHHYSVIRVVSVFFANYIIMKCVFFASGKCIVSKLNLRISLVNHFSEANFFVSGLIILVEQTFQRRDPKLIILVVNHFSGKRL